MTRGAREPRPAPPRAPGARPSRREGAGRTDPPPSEGRGETRHVVETCFCARPHCDGWIGSGRGIGKKKTRPVPLVWFRACTATETARSTRRGDREESKDDWVVHRRTNGICGRCFYADGVRVRAHANDRGDRSSFSSRSRRFPVCFRNARETCLSRVFVSYKRGGTRRVVLHPNSRTGGTASAGFNHRGGSTLSVLQCRSRRRRSRTKEVPVRAWVLNGVEGRASV